MESLGSTALFLSYKRSMPAYSGKRIGGLGMYVHLRVHILFIL